MTAATQIKKIHALTAEVETVAAENTKVLEADQQFQNELSQYMRDEDARIRDLREQFMLQVQTLKQESAKATNEYRQTLNELRTTWRKTFAFTTPDLAPAPVQVETTDAV